MDRTVLFKHVIPSQYKTTRLSDILLEEIRIVNSKSELKKRIKKKLVLVNDTVATTGTWIYPGDEIIFLSHNESIPKTYPLSYEVLYQDDHLAVVNKPAGIIVSGNKHRTLENSLPFNLFPSQKEDALLQMRPVHRLDSDTSGLLIVAKTQNTLQKLNTQFQDKNICKEYIAIVSGKTPEKGRISTLVNGKNAITDFELLHAIDSNKYGRLSFVKVNIKTGRTHQIRIHFADSGHPIIGDKKYNHLKSGQIKGLYLHAAKLRFRHPENDKEMIISAPAPKKFMLFNVGLS